jgi:hypothetical protein
MPAPHIHIPGIFRKPLKAAIEIHARAAGALAATAAIDALRPEIGNMGLVLIAGKVGSRTCIAFQRAQRGLLDGSFLASASSASLAVAAFTCRTGSIFFSYIQCDKFSVTLYGASVIFSAGSDQLVGEFSFIKSFFG